MTEVTAISVRLDRSYMEKVEKWRKKLQAEMPGVNITVSDTVRSMIGEADKWTLVPRPMFRRASEKSGKR